MDKPSSSNHDRGADRATFKNPHSEAKDLPIASYREALVDAISQSSCLVIIGETGSGKTTQLPQYLLEAGLAKNGAIVVTQPRRIAAISVAQRVAEEVGCEIGGTVGYEVRFDKVTTPATKIKFVTDGCLVRECLQDNSLSKYSVIILDEAHIRSMDTDVLFGLAKQFITGKKNTPKLVVMSATLEHQKFSEFFGCNVFHIPGRTFPVSITYCDAIGSKDVGTTGHASKAVEIAMKLHCTKATGDILIFLTGRDEIEKACKDLYTRSEKLDYRYDVTCTDVDALLILPMYGSMSTDEQRRVFRAAPRGVRKVVLATDIASTSLTIDGIVYVVDSGFCKQKVFNPNTGLDALRVVPISRSEASQRSGRAGRTKAGECYRLVSEEFDEMHMLDFTPPEIQRTSLTSVVLTLKSLGIKDVLKFHYLDPPEERMLLEALRELYYFDALDNNGDVTALGKQMGAFPLPPHLSRVVLHAAERRCEEPVLKIVSMLSVEQILIRPGNKAKQEQATECHTQLLSAGGDDFTNLLLMYDIFDTIADPRGWCRENFVHFRAVGGARRTKQQLEQILHSKYVEGNANATNNNYNNNNNNTTITTTTTANSSSSNHNNNSDTTSSAESGSNKRRKQDTESRHTKNNNNHNNNNNNNDNNDNNDDDDNNNNGRAAIKEAMEEYYDWVSALTELHRINRVHGVGLPSAIVMVVRKALCYGYFNNVARRGSNFFSTMDGHATSVSIHPSSFLFNTQHNLDWIMYHEVVFTSKPFMRTITPIKYEWVKELLKKLHEVNHRMLSATGEVSQSAITEMQKKENEQQPATVVVARRNTDATIEAAKQRYLERKRAREAKG